MMKQFTSLYLMCSTCSLQGKCFVFPLTSKDHKRDGEVYCCRKRIEKEEVKLEKEGIIPSHQGSARVMHFEPGTPIAAICKDCAHRIVCSKKEKALELEKEHVSVAIEDSFKVSLTCTHHIKQVTNTRGPRKGWSDYEV